MDRTEQEASWFLQCSSFPLSTSSFGYGYVRSRRHSQIHSRAVYRTLPPEVTNELAYVPDQMILDFLFTKVHISKEATKPKTTPFRS